MKNLREKGKSDFCCSVLLLLVFLTVLSCKTRHRVLSLYEQTPLSEIAEYIDDENVVKIEQVIKANPNYLTYNEPKSGNNLLFLTLLLKKYNSFKTLIDLGASPNSINTYSLHSILVAACDFCNNIEG